MGGAADSGEALRVRGLRVTPQRRAILGAFEQAPVEHLSADEVHARAAAVIPEIGRGTVYATLAELTEVGILIARGSPEPVRYETNTAPHQHFRCRLCLRLFDVDIPEPSAESLATEGYVVEQMTVTAEGICAECVDYDHGLRIGARHARSKPSPDLPAPVAAATIDTPVGPLTIGATAEGVVRVIFDSHADAGALHEAVRARRGSRAARAHIATAKAGVADYFAGDIPREQTIDWETIEGAETLRAVMAIPRAQDASYDVLDTAAEASERGRILGANPIAIFIPCHRVTRGREVPGEYVGGIDQRGALRKAERSQ